MAKVIYIKAVIEGSGIVNFDSIEQKKLWNKQKDVENTEQYNNIMFGKGRYYKDPDNEGFLKKVGVISADCIRHTMYEDNMPQHLLNIMYDDALLLRAIAHPAFIERGYMFAKKIAKEKTGILKRTSGFGLSYAKIVESSESSLETYSNTQPKTGNDKSEKKSETSLFRREVRGETKYELSGQINIGELGFISMSDVHDRMNVHPDLAEVYKEELSKNIGSKVPDVGYYLKNEDLYQIPEYGIQLTKEQVQFLIADILKRLARFNVTRSVSGNARTTNVKIKIVNDAFNDFFDDDGWIEIFNRGNLAIDVISDIDVEPGYTLTDLEEAKAKVEDFKNKFGLVVAKKPKSKSKKVTTTTDTNE